MDTEIRYRGNHNKCPACSCRDDKVEIPERTRVSGGIEYWSNYRVGQTKLCIPESCQDNSKRHLHKSCQRCGATWLDCWKADKVSFWKWW